MPNVNAESGKNYERRVLAALTDFSPDFRPFKPAQPSWSDRGDIRFSTVVLQAKTSNVGTKTMLKHLADVEWQAATYEFHDDLTPAVIVSTSPDVQDDLVVLRAVDFFALVAQRDALDPDREDF